jgi:hypothetical protein
MRCMSWYALQVTGYLANNVWFGFEAHGADVRKRSGQKSCFQNGIIVCESEMENWTLSEVDMEA